MTLFDARMLLYPVHQGSSDSAWNWVRACLPAEVTIPMNAPTPDELERVIRSDARARRALIAQRMKRRGGKDVLSVPDAGLYGHDVRRAGRP